MVQREHEKGTATAAQQSSNTWGDWTLGPFKTDHGGSNATLTSGQEFDVDWFNDVSTYTGVDPRTGTFTVNHATIIGSPDELAADYLHDSKHVFNDNPLNPVYTKWFIGGKRQSIFELDERDASEFAIKVGAKIDLDWEKGYKKYQDVLMDSICNHQWWRTNP